MQFRGSPGPGVMYPEDKFNTKLGECIAPLYFIYLILFYFFIYMDDQNKWPCLFQALHPKLRTNCYNSLQAVSAHDVTVFLQAEISFSFLFFLFIDNLFLSQSFTLAVILTQIRNHLFLVISLHSWLPVWIISLAKRDRAAHLRLFDTHTIAITFLTILPRFSISSPPTDLKQELLGKFRTVDQHQSLLNNIGS